jgi:hypothetical protein
MHKCIEMVTVHLIEQNLLVNKVVPFHSGFSYSHISPLPTAVVQNDNYFACTCWKFFLFTVLRPAQEFFLYMETSSGLQNLGVWSALRAFVKGNVFIVSHLLGHGPSIFPVSDHPISQFKTCMGFGGSILPG